MDLAEISPFFTQKTPILHFLLLTVFFTVLVVVFGQPLGLLHFTEDRSELDGHLQVSLMAAAGLMVVSASRWLLSGYSHRRNAAPMTILIWLLAELIAVIAVMELVLWGLSGGGRLQMAPLAADLLMGILIVEALPYVIAMLVFRLRLEHAEVLRLHALVEDLHPADALNASGQSERTVNFHDKGGRLVFSTQGGNILYIEAADNYVNIHYLNDGHEDTFILHNSLKELEQRMQGGFMLRCHRGYMVNVDNVKLLRKEGQQLLMELNGSAKVIPVTKTYASSVTERLAPPSID